MRNEAQAFVVLFTPDEHARLLDPKPHDKAEDKERFQARPNVIFEAGMAMGIDDRRTIVMTLGNVQLFSDFDGRHVLRMNNSVEKRDDFKARLETAGCILSPDSDWHKAGDFDGAVASPPTAKKANAPTPPRDFVKEATPEPALSDDAIEMRLIGWLKKNEDGDVADGTPVEEARIEAEAKIPPGSVGKLLEKALESQERWTLTNRKGGYVILELGPAFVRDIESPFRGSRRR